MSNKLKFLTKMSLNKKIKTKWFLVANGLFLLLIVGLINIDSIIKLFGGKFEQEQQILVIDEVGVMDEFKVIYDSYSEKMMNTNKGSIIKYEGTYDEGVEEVSTLDKLLLVISKDEENYLKAKLVSNENVGTMTNAVINASLATVKNELVVKKYNITNEMMNEMNSMVEVQNVSLSDKDTENDMMTSTILEIIMLPLFMLIMFLVQMIGAEVNEEKSTRSMEIIISNVSPKTHFISKVLASNLFVLIQGGLVLLFAFIGLGIRYFMSGGNLLGSFDGEIQQVIDSISLTGVTNTLTYMIPIIIVMVILTFLAYSLLAGILASMTTNQEDFQQLQAPIVIVSLIGFYLSMMAGLFKGSIFIKIMSYIPFVSAMLSPTLYLMGEVGLVDLGISIILLVGTIYLLIKYGLRIYKVGILNYSQSGLWKKMFRAMKDK
ncbi:MAG: ABC transporter permease [bacterium]|nr:ABC transporter permease [bacterium]